MFAPDTMVGAAASARLSSGSAFARRGSKPPSLPVRPATSLGSMYQSYSNEGEEASSCPNGHALEQTILPSGGKASCNRCGKHVKAGQCVMICRPCNFGLCSDCSDSGHQEPSIDAESAASLTNLCALGFAYEDAKAALNAAGGDAEQAASLLLAAAEMDVDTGSHTPGLDQQVGPIVID